MKTGDLNRKNVSIHLDTHARIGGYGAIVDSYDDVINAITDFAESKGMTKDALDRFRRAKNNERDSTNAVLVGGVLPTA